MHNAWHINLLFIQAPRKHDVWVLHKTMKLCRKNGPRIGRQGKTNEPNLIYGKLKRGSSLSWV